MIRTAQAGNAEFLSHVDDVTLDRIRYDTNLDLQHLRAEIRRCEKDVEVILAEQLRRNR